MNEAMDEYIVFFSKIISQFEYLKNNISNSTKIFNQDY